MVAARLSPIGVGNDLLGSVRIPAAFNGIVGLLSSTGRLPTMNTAT
jgi:amidase